MGPHDRARTRDPDPRDDERDQWNDRVERVLEHLPTSFAISVDGLTPETIARVRVGADPQRVLANLDRFQAYTERRGTYLA